MEMAKTTVKKISIMLGCMGEKEVCRTRGRGRIIMLHHKTWRQTFRVPDKGNRGYNVVCPFCDGFFQVRVYSKIKARFRKIFFASSFFSIAASGIVLGVFAGRKTGFLALALAAPFMCFAIWQLFNIIRGSFDPSDMVTHGRGKVHRIFDDRKITFPDASNILDD
jgi:hypothetical protein